MSTTSELDRLDRARAFCVEHLQQCCAELVERSETGILPPGRVRELATLCTFPGLPFQLSLAEKLIVDEALKAVGTPKPKPTATGTGPRI